MKTLWSFSLYSLPLYITTHCQLAFPSLPVKLESKILDFQAFVEPNNRVPDLKKVSGKFLLSWWVEGTGSFSLYTEGVSYFSPINQKAILRIVFIFTFPVQNFPLNFRFKQLPAQQIPWVISQAPHAEQVQNGICHYWPHFPLVLL